MGFIAAGGQCCCCRDFIRIIEQRLISEFVGTAGNTKSRVVSPSKDVEYPATVSFRPDQTTKWTDGCSCADWKNERIWGTYGVKLPSAASWLDTQTVFSTWDAKDREGIGPAVEQFRLSSYYVDSLAADSRNEKLYYSGSPYQHPFLDGMDTDWSTELKSINFDGTDDTLLDTIPLYRSSSGGTGWSGSGSMFIYPPKNRLYYVKMQNVTTSGPTEYVANICYRDTGDITTENVIYEKALARTLLDIGDGYVRGIGCISFDLEREKIYWVEMYRLISTFNRVIGWAKRANLDGTGEETLYQSVDPYRISFVRYSNKIKKIVHCDSNRLDRGAGSLPGIWERNPEDWDDGKLVSLNRRPNDWGGSAGTANIFGTGMPILWCGYEVTGANAVL